VTVAITTVAVIICAGGILRTGRAFTRHPGHRVAGRALASSDVPSTQPLELNGETPYVEHDVPVYPVEYAKVVETVHDLPRFEDPDETHELPTVEDVDAALLLANEAFEEVERYTPTEPNVVVDPDEFYIEDEDPAEIRRIFDESTKVVTAHPLESYCRRHPTEPCTCPDEDWISTDDTGDWPAIQESQLVDLDAGTTAEFQRFWEGDEENDPNWVHGLREGTVNSRAIRRLKRLVRERGWSSSGTHQDTPRSAGKRRKKRTLVQRLHPEEEKRERPARKRSAPGRHRLTAQEQEAHGVDDDQAGM
jgi:hypothetical protein